MADEPRSIWALHLSGSSICAATTSLPPNLGASVNGDLAPGLSYNELGSLLDDDERAQRVKEALTQKDWGLEALEATLTGSAHPPQPRRALASAPPPHP